MKKISTPSLAQLLVSTAVALTLGMTGTLAFAKDKDKKDKKDDTPAAVKPMSGELASWDSKEDVPQLGKIKVKGAVSYNTGNLTTNYLGFDNKVSFKGVDMTISCKALVTSKTTICVNLIKKTVEGANGTDLSCTIAGMSGKMPDLPASPKLDVCTDFKMTGSANQNPKGKMKIYAEAGGAGQYKKVSILSKDF